MAKQAMTATAHRRGAPIRKLQAARIVGAILLSVSCSPSSSTKDAVSDNDTRGSGALANSNSGGGLPGAVDSDAGGAVTHATGAIRGTGALAGASGIPEDPGAGGGTTKSEGESTLEPEGDLDVDRSSDACHEEPLTAPEIPIQQVGGIRPELVGGELADGRYEMIKYELFGTPAGSLPETHRQTLIFSEDATWLESIKTERNDELFSWSGPVDLNGAEMVVELTCPQLRAGTAYYTFETQGSLLRVGLTQGDVPVLLTYRRNEEIIR